MAVCACESLSAVFASQTLFATTWRYDYQPLKDRLQ
jgi:hypothetical protein